MKSNNKTSQLGYSNLMLSSAFLCIGIVLGASYVALTVGNRTYSRYGNRSMMMNRDYMPLGVEPYSMEENMATFKVMPMKDGTEYSKVTYWTDESGACDAMTSDYSELVEVPVDENVDYTFFQFTDEYGEKTPIYATSHRPIFQCGAMAQ